MVDGLVLPKPTPIKDPPAGYYFQVTFFADGNKPNQLDIRFQKVSGITATVETEPLTEGGENLLAYHLPKGITYENLKLERGMVIDSPLNAEFNDTMNLFQFKPGNVMVSLLDENNKPIANWLFLQAYAVKWSISDLDATANGIVIDTMELTFTRFQILKD